MDAPGESADLARTFSVASHAPRTAIEDGPVALATGPFRIHPVARSGTPLAEVVAPPLVGVVVALDEVLTVVLLVGPAGAPFVAPSVETELVGAVALRVRVRLATVIGSVVLAALEARAVSVLSRR